MKKFVLIFLLTFGAFSLDAQWTDSGNNLTTSDNVGIGTANPLSKLQVNSYTGSGTAYSLGSITSFANSGNIGLYLGVANENIGGRGWGFSVRSVGVNSSLDIIEKGLDGTRISIASGGLVGIGTTAPSKKLDIYNAIAEESFRLTTGTDGRVLTMRGETINFNRAGSNYIAASHASGELVFSTGGSNIYDSQIRMRIKADGSVGIGTGSTGTHRLAVDGSIGARKVKVEATGWSDFVFENDYYLRPLKEVELFISHHKHLPEIPSAEEVKLNGIDLGEMDSKLLQKIEELTLYLIEQNKQNQAQQVRIEKLEKELEALKKK
ncbi:hypothetical protein [Roseivirga thermotolerans]|uniref:hypothetical protein n=1 Tax=Roseivirga thermotolerans TaxID=1758176 RepID=UPI00273FE582|nr:hypothetical protein [Roseivirga thermotolerans]